MRLWFQVEMENIDAAGKRFYKYRQRNLLDLTDVDLWGGEVNWLLNVTINDISVIYVAAHTFRCAGGLKKKLYVRSDVGLPTP